jgi:hypothetical protein
MVTTIPEVKTVNPLDAKMTPAQIARRKFKSGLPRKIPNRVLSPMEALGETFTLLDRFRGLVVYEKGDPAAATTVYAALAYSLPAPAAKFVYTMTVPEPPIGKFCDAVLALGHDNAQFLGVVFIHVDPDAENRAYKAVSFVAQFVGGSEAEGRLLAAQKDELARVQKTLEKLTR